MKKYLTSAAAVFAAGTVAGTATPASAGPDFNDVVRGAATIGRTYSTIRRNDQQYDIQQQRIDAQREREQMRADEARYREDTRRGQNADTNQYRNRALDYKYGAAPQSNYTGTSGGSPSSFAVQQERSFRAQENPYAKPAGAMKCEEATITHKNGTVSSGYMCNTPQGWKFMPN